MVKKELEEAIYASENIRRREKPFSRTPHSYP